MRLLLDSHVLLWVADGSLSPHARAVIEDEAESVFVSAATIWELEIKRASGRLALPRDPVHAVGAAGYESLPIRAEHGVAAARLPLHHGDPFDRMLVAQAQLEGLTLATSDQGLGRYGVPLFAVTRA